MQQRWWLNLALLLLIIILGGIVYYTLEQEKKAKTPPLTNLTTAAVTDISIERASAETIQLLKDDDNVWHLIAPFTLPANQFRVERLLEVLTTSDYQVLEGDNINLATLKLDPPLVSIRFDQLTLDFGDSTPMNDGKRYLLMKQKVYLFTDTLFYSLNEEATQFVSRSPLGEKSKIVELQLPDYHLMQVENQWQLASSKHVNTEIDTSAKTLEKLVEKWQNLQSFNVERYQADSESKIDDETDEVEKTVTIQLQRQPQPIKFILLTTAPDFILARPDQGVQYQLPSREVDQLLHLPTAPKLSTK